jgi:DNA-binding MarR family transcriptional regulator
LAVAGEEQAFLASKLRFMAPLPHICNPETLRTVCFSLKQYIVLRYTIIVMNKGRMRAPAAKLQILAEFRHRLRLFLHFSETAAQKRGLQPQQHQLLLQIAGAPDKVAATIGHAAERLGLCHNTMVELSNRCEAAGLITRKQARSDRRCVLLELTLAGRKKLEALSIDHEAELNDLAPKLIRTLTALREAKRNPGKRRARGTSGI